MNFKQSSSIPLLLRALYKFDSRILLSSAFFFIDLS